MRRGPRGRGEAASRGRAISGLLLGLHLGLLLSALAPGRAAAQVNAEGLRRDLFHAGWSGALDASLALSRGNIELLDVGGGGHVQFQTLHPAPPSAPPPEAALTTAAATPAPGTAEAPQGTAPQAAAPMAAAPAALPYFRHRALLTANIRFAQNDRGNFINQAFVHGRWTAMWHRRLGSDLFGQFQYNQFLRLQARAIAGAGVRIDAVHLRPFLLWLGSGYMLEYERITVAEGAADAPEAYNHRWTSYLAARLALFGDRLLLQDTLYAQPRFDDFGDVRVLNEVQAQAKVSELFALGVTLGVLYDSQPPTGVVPLDLRLLTTLHLAFK